MRGAPVIFLAAAMLAGCSGAGSPATSTTASPQLERVEAPESARIDYVMVAPRAFHPALRKLALHRDKLGHGVQLLASEDVFGDGTGQHRLHAEDLRELLRARLEHQPLRYLLLVGDMPQVPSFQHDGGSYGGGYRARSYLSDHPYALWDEPRGGLAVGRVPARTTAEVERFVSKVIHYETSADDGVWQRRLSMVAGPANFGALVDGIIESKAAELLDQRLSYDYDLDLVFANEGSPYAFRFDRLGDKLVSDLEEGALMAVYIGHGAPRSFDSVTFRDHRYSIGDVDEIERLHVKRGNPFFVSLTCLTGRLGEPDRSIAERMVMNPNGPVAVFASSSQSHPYPNALYAEALMNQFLDQRASTVGDGVVASKRHVTDSDMPLARWLVPGNVSAIKSANVAMYNLLGDPATRLRYPDRATVGVPREIAPGGAFQVAIDAGVEGLATVTVETERGIVRGEMVSEREMGALSDAEALEAMSRNHARASDKVVSRHEVTVARGTTTLTLTAPSQPGEYVVKAFTVSPDQNDSSVGHARIRVGAATVVPPAPPRRNVAARAVQTTSDI